MEVIEHGPEDFEHVTLADEDEGIDEGAILAAIVEELDGRAWTADTAANIAEILRGAGFEIRDVE